MSKKSNFEKEYDIRITIKGIMLFEKLAGKSYFSITDEDIPTLMYALFVTSNNKYLMSIESFFWLLGCNAFAESLIDKMKFEIDYNSIGSINSVIGETEEISEEARNVRLSEIASSLIIDYGMDADYVMNKMNVWEIDEFVLAAEKKNKNDLEDKRLWSYIGILPHIDSSKIAGPSGMIEFPWEKNEKKDKLTKSIEEEADALRNTIGQKISFKKKEENEGLDIDVERE